MDHNNPLALWKSLRDSCTDSRECSDQVPVHRTAARVGDDNGDLPRPVDRLS